MKIEMKVLVRSVSANGQNGVNVAMSPATEDGATGPGPAGMPPQGALPTVNLQVPLEMGVQLMTNLNKEVSIVIEG
jgi:hypothetical protein